MISEKIEFAGADGSMLAGRLDRPDGRVRACALFAHCFTCGKDILAASRISRSLTDQGFAVLRFDFTGIGTSEGDFENTSFSSNVGDLCSAADYLKQRMQAPSVLIGHSLGGAAVLAAAPSISGVKAVVTLAAPSDPAHIQKQFAGGEPSPANPGGMNVTLGMRTFTITPQFIDDLHAQDLMASVRSLRGALLVMHAPQDMVVAIDHARRIFDAAQHPKSFVSLDGADHLLSSRSDAMYIGQIIATWVSRYIPDVAGLQSAPSDDALCVSSVEDGPFITDIAVRNHRMWADEPLEDGGDDTGPAPYDFLLAALGSCTAMTLRMYARAKHWPLEHVSVRLTHASAHASDCVDCPSGVGTVLEIHRQIYVVGDLDAPKKQRLLEIADRCPVHRAITGQVRVRSRLE